MFQHFRAGCIADNRVQAIGLGDARTLRVQLNDRLARALRAYRDDRRESSMMHKMTLPYSDTMIEAISSSYASRPAQ